MSGRTVGEVGRRRNQTGAEAPADVAGTGEGRAGPNSVVALSHLQREQRVSVRTLRVGDSPRLAGENTEYTRVLAESEMALPPILVHRATMRVIDGMHRLGAARLRGDETIDVEFFEGPDDDVFITAVRANIEHGLPLTLADRQAAATRILASHPQYSDRSIATITGLASKTIAEIRRRTRPDADRATTTRVGRDGRLRPLDSTQARRLASEAITQRPQASLREIARTVGLSPTTVRDVRERMRRGEDPAPPSRPADRRDTAAARATTLMAAGIIDTRGPEPTGEAPDRHADSTRARLLDSLRNNPSLRFSESGRALLRVLLARSSGPPGPELLQSLPPHCAYTIAALARACAREWLEFAHQMEFRFELRVEDAAEQSGA